MYPVHFQHIGWLFRLRWKAAATALSCRANDDWQHTIRGCITRYCSKTSFICPWCRDECGVLHALVEVVVLVLHLPTDYVGRFGSTWMQLRLRCNHLHPITITLLSATLLTSRLAVVWNVRKAPGDAFETCFVASPFERRRLIGSAFMFAWTRAEITGQHYQKVQLHGQSRASEVVVVGWN